MKHNLDDLQIKGLEQKIKEYNALHRKVILNINDKDTWDIQKEMNAILTWFKQKGLSFDKSSHQWELFIEGLNGTPEEKDTLTKIREEKTENLRKQKYEAASDLRKKEREILHKWAKPVNAEDFYKTHEILNFVNQFIIRKNVCDYYLES